MGNRSSSSNNPQHTQQRQQSRRGSSMFGRRRRSVQSGSRKNKSSNAAPSALLARITQDLPDQAVVIRNDVFTAHCVNIELGPQCKGPGALVLTRDQLWFSLGNPRTDIFVELLDIEDVRTEESHYEQGKVVKDPVLTITFDDPALRAENRLSLRFASHHPEQDCSDWEEAIGRQINLARRLLSDESTEAQICNQSPATIMTTYTNEEAAGGAMLHTNY